MDRTKYNPSRREALATALAFPAVVAIGGVAACSTAASAASGAKRIAWDRAFAEMEKARVDYAKADAYCDPIWKAYKSASEAIPHVTVEFAGVAVIGTKLSTANAMQLASAQAVAKRPDLNTPYAEACRKLVAAQEAREAEEERISKRLGKDAAFDELERTCERLCAAEGVLLEMDAPDGQALLWKLEFLFSGEDRNEDGYCPEWCIKWVNQFMADARRLLSDGRA